jgi:sporulation protein YunB
MAVAAAANAVTQTVNSAVVRKMAAGTLEYSDIITLDKDADGHVSALTTNMAKINMLKSELSDEITESITLNNMINVHVPFGNLFNSNLTSGAGPDVAVRIVLANAAALDFTNLFSSSGINQTQHRIALDVIVNISVLIPGGAVQTSVKTHIIVAETVIVGSVPENFTYFEGSEEWDTNLEKFDITH